MTTHAPTCDLLVRHGACSCAAPDIDLLREEFWAAWRRLHEGLVATCPAGRDHKPVTHRDTHPQWCRACRRTALGVYIARPGEDR